MAMVLDALASYIQSMLTEMAKDEVRMLLGVPYEMKKMGVKLGDIKKFLADADRRNITDELVQGWVKEFKGSMYDATDILDLCQLKTMKRGPSRDMGFLNPLLFCMRNPLYAHDIGSRLRNLNEKLDDIIKRSMTFNFNLTSYEDHGRKMESSHHLASRETTGELELVVIGEKINEDTRNLVEMLTRKEETIHEGNKVMVFAIVGVGGIGKTTLVKNIFNNEIIQEEFQKKIWVSVNQDYSDIELLRRTIEAGGGNQAAVGFTMVMLQQTLKETLEGCKTLLVMDDVWNYRAWEDVLKTPLTNALAQGSRVLVTTRNYRVARGMMAEEPYHNIEKLNPEDAWSLLKKQVIRNENDEAQVDVLKDIGMGIVQKCDGLPLAVKVMGGLLRQKNIRWSDWENVLKASIWSVSQMPEELNNAIYLSYQDLPPSLKPCFLLFSLLPKSTKFYVDDIIGMWISEGFVHGNLDDLENIGREYYAELISRNLIEPNVKHLDQVVCSMHDVVCSFAQYVARDEALVAGHSSKIDLTGKLNSEKFFRLSLENKGPESDVLEWRSLQAQISVRTLISIGNIKINPGDSLVAFSSLRTLHVQDAEFDTLAKSLVKLKHLRYLSIEFTKTSILPENIHKMKFLQYISLFGCQSLMKLPSSIRKLQDLRFLNINRTKISNISKGFSGLTSLRKLYGFPAHMDGDWCSLEELGPLSKLTKLSIYGLVNVSSSSIVRKINFVGKVYLSFLHLNCTSRHGDSGQLFKEENNISGEGQQKIKEVFDELCPSPSLEKLIINGYFGRQLPRWMTSNAVVPLGRLRLLGLEDLPCCTEIPDSLCQLPCLEFLQIKKAPAIKRVGPEFLQPHYHEHLSELQVIQCSDLERICNLPKLQELTIFKCPKLKVLEGLHSLQRLNLQDYGMCTLPRYLQDANPSHLLLIDCAVSLLTSIAIGKSSSEWDKFSHIKQVKAYANDNDNNITRKWYVSYTRDPFSFKTNISLSAI